MGALYVHLLSDVLGRALLFGAPLFTGGHLVLGQVGGPVVGTCLFLYPGTYQVLGSTGVRC